MTTAAAPAPRPLRPLAAVTGALSTVAAWIATVIVIVAGVGIVGSIFANVARRELTGTSIYGAEEFARFAFLWLIWMGVSLAVRRGAVTVITIVAAKGPWWWRASVHTLANGLLAALLIYSCIRTTEYVRSPESLDAVSSALRWPFWIPILSMTVGYFFITIHYAHALVVGTGRLLEKGPRETVRLVTAGLVGGGILFLVFFGVLYVMLDAGLSPLIPLGFAFITLTLAGMPIVFMLSLVGIIGAVGPLGLEFFPFGGEDPLFPFRTTQATMGLSSGGELIVIFEFLLVAELMNATGLSQRMIRMAASLVGHFRGGMAYVCQLTSALLSGISGSAQADAAVMTPLLVPAMEKEGYRKDVAAAVVTGASIKGPVGPISIMFIAYGFIVSGVGAAPIDQMLVTGILLVLGLLILQAAVISVVVRRIGMTAPHGFLGWREVGASTIGGIGVLLIPIVILGGILSGFYTPTESASVAVVLTLVLGLVYRSLSIGALYRAGVLAAIETGVVMLLLGDSAILSKLLFIDGFGQSLQEWVTGITSNEYVFLLIVIGLLLVVGIFVEPLPALFILAPFLAPVAVGIYGIDPVQFAVVVVFSLVLGLIHPPVGLVLFLVSSISRVPVERLSLTVLPWLGISLVGLLIVAFIPADWLTWLAEWAT